MAAMAHFFLRQISHEQTGSWTVRWLLPYAACKFYTTAPRCSRHRTYGKHRIKALDIAMVHRQ
jgi:hypothetical protein